MVGLKEGVPVKEGVLQGVGVQEEVIAFVTVPVEETV